MSRKQANSRDLACGYRNANCRYTHAHGIANRYARAYCHATNRHARAHCRANTETNADRATP
jgi:hypothetical protein